MCYTLRLLTAQQFQRAAGLICAMDYLRRQDPTTLGEEPFSIGIWVGGDTTPNTRAEAVTALNALRKNPAKADNPFVLAKCPWCAAQLADEPHGGVIVLTEAVLTAVPEILDRRAEAVNGVLGSPVFSGLKYDESCLAGKDRLRSDGVSRENGRQTDL